MEKACHIIPKSEMNMTQELWKILPSEIIMSILSKLPVRTITICKCVCKSWLHLVETQEFVEFHLSTSLPGFVTFQGGPLPSLVKFFEVEDGRDVERHDLQYNLVTQFSFPNGRFINGSVDGLLWLRDCRSTGDVIYICNPITRDYIRIRSLPESPDTVHRCGTWGVGSCKMTGQYKVVRILHDRIFDVEAHINDRFISVAECHVYTLGTGSGWRRFAPFALHSLRRHETQPGAFVNGNLHWLGCDSEERLWISCFDLETESFSNFYAPPLDGAQRGYLHGAQRIGFFKLFALGESLCLIDKTYENEFVIWFMEEYGIAKSWTKKLVINEHLGERRAFELRPFKLFKDGDILIGINCSKLFYYSSKTKTIQQVDMLKENCPSTSFLAISHTPSFRSLKSFGMENVISL